VFQDIDSIEPGSGWKDRIDDAIRGSERMLVFWCAHAAKSDQVQREYELALRLAKGVVPVLLDNTPLAQALAPISGVDLRELGTHGPQYRFAVPVPGGRNPYEVIAHGFAQALDMDPIVLVSNLFPAAAGPPL
jgi:TIR domain